MTISPGLLTRYGIPAHLSSSWVDDLTGLPNRRYLLHALDSMISSGREFSLLFLDLDGFKQVNDTMGHGEGDQVLAKAAGILVNMIRSDDRPVRFGGDEFIVLVPGRDSGRRVAERLLEAFDSVLKPRWGVGASIGEAVHPDHGLTGAEVLRAADQAMYRAKSSGGNCFRRAGESGGSLFWNDDVFVCREAETDRAVRLLSGPLNSGLLITGDPGSGKTSILERIAAGLEGRMVYRLDARPELSGISWAPLVTWVRKVASIPAESVSGPLTSVLARVFPGVFPGMTPSQARPDLLAVLEALSGLFATRLPLTFMVDNAGWLDRDTASFLGYALRVGIPSGFSLVLASRCDSIDELASVFPGYGQLERLNLDPFSHDQVIELVRARLGSVQPGSGIASKVFSFSGGNPLFACEYLRAGCSPEGEFTGEGFPGEGQGVSVPDKVEQIVKGRLRVLSEGCLTVLRHASAERRGNLTLEAITSALNLPEGEVMGFLDDGVKAGVLSSGGQALLSFRYSNEAARLAVYAAAPRSVLMAAHESLSKVYREAGDYLEAGYHLERGSNPKRAYDNYVEGAGVYKKTGLPGAGVACLERAKAILQSGSHRQRTAARAFQLAESLLYSLVDCGLWEKAREAAAESAELAVEAGFPERAVAHRLLAVDSLRVLGRSSEAVTSLKAMLAVTEGVNRIDTLIKLSDSLSRIGRAREALEYLEEAETILDAGMARYDEMVTHVEHKKLMTAIALNRPEMGFAACRGILRFRRSLATFHWYFIHDIGEFHLICGMPLKAMEDLKEAQRISEAQASFYGRACSLSLGVDACYHGLDDESTETWLREVEEMAGRLNDDAILQEMSLIRCRLLLEGDHVDLAADAIKPLLRQRPECPATAYTSSLLLMRTGDTAGSLNEAARAGTTIPGDCLAPININSITITRDEIELQKEWAFIVLENPGDAPQRLSRFITSASPRAAFRASGLLAELLHRSGSNEKAEEVLIRSLEKREWLEMRRQRHENLMIGGAWNDAFRDEAMGMNHSGFNKVKSGFEDS